MEKFRLAQGLNQPPIDIKSDAQSLFMTVIMSRGEREKGVSEYK